ncbi:hypothetical protein HDU88_005581 [Geranomyces variabilis]|nr:hypothetical protein HDU88_005581 [Geranomyces variabilis]
MPADTRRASAGAAASPPGGFLAKLRLRKATDASTSSTNTNTSSSSSSLQPPPPPPLKPSIRTSSSAFSSMHDPQRPSRKAFAALLSDPHQFAPFRQKYSSHPECAPLILFCDGYNRLETLLIAICTGTDVHSAALLATPTDQSAIRRFLDEAKSPIIQDNDDDDGDDSAFPDIVSIPEWLSTLLLRFQETFVMSGGQHEIKQLSSAARLSVAYGLKHIGENRVRVSVFDECAAEVHEMLFERYYPEFLASGANLHRLRESGGQQYHHPHPHPPPPSVYASASASVARAAEETSAGPFRGEQIAARNSRSRSSSRNNNHRSDISSNSQSRSRSRSRSHSSEDERDSRLLRPSASSQQQSGRQFKWKSLTLLGRSKSRASSADRVKQGTTTPPPMPPMPYQYTREDFIRLLFDVEGYSDFVAFAKETLCLENIMFYEAFVRLELQIGETLPADAATGGIIPRTDTGLTRCLVRFLENNALQPTRPDPQQYYVPTPLMTNLILFYSTFIMPGAQHEVNISHALRKAIVSALHKRGDEEGAEGIGGKGLPALVRDQGVAISVFDDAADEILDMLYRNTYHLYLRQRADAGGGSGGSGPRGARNKKEGRNSSPVC